MTPALQNLLHDHRLWRGNRSLGPVPAIATGFEALDAELPGRGWPVGALTELMASRRGIGELQLLMPSLAALTCSGKRVLWLAPPHLPYAPALAAAGVDLANLAVVRAPGRRDALWAAEQALRAGSCHALLAWFRHARYEELRRLAVAAEAGGAFAALFRPPDAERESSPAALRIALAPAGSELELRILKRRGPASALPLRLRLQRPFNALGRPAFPKAPGREAGEHRRLDVPVHA